MHSLLLIKPNAGILYTQTPIESIKGTYPEVGCLGVEMVVGLASPRRCPLTRPQSSSRCPGVSGGEGEEYHHVRVPYNNIF